MKIADRELTDHAFRLCQQLIRIDTTNPPGNERAAADLVATELSAAGLSPTLLESAPGRANVVARLKGNGEKPPLLLTAHLDVVEAEPDAWTHPPFSGEVADGCLWGRGAIDMKNMAAMSLAILARLAREGVTPKRDLIFAAVADEEAGCRYGSLWLCDNHRSLVESEFAIGEGGGFNLFVAGKSFTTVQVAEKGVAWIKARVHGQPGHGSMPREDSAVIRLAEAVARLGRQGLEPHATPVVRDFVAALAARQPAGVRQLITTLLRPSLAAPVLKRLPDASVARALRAMLENTASPTVLRAGAKTNVIPGVAEVEIDGRMLPGQSVDDLLRELRAVLGEEFELEVMHTLPPVVTEPRGSDLYDTICAVVGEREPDSPVVPYLLPGFTDAKAFTSIGARWYGFAPVKMPREIRFADLFHGHDERIPVEGLAWGTEVLAEVVTRFITAG
ncbi:MAG: M20/M25/M40 family metallo-hydrolase [Myxococcales bacterium]|nr:M20/M25/M40 family metallo-hydrolase [Myxococcales bacterium]